MVQGTLLVDSLVLAMQKTLVQSRMQKHSKYDEKWK